MNITDSFANFHSRVSPGQNIPPRVPPANQKVMTNPSLQGQQNLSSPPLQQNSSPSPLPRHHNVSDQISSHQNLSGPSLQEQNFNTSLLQGQQNATLLPGQQNISNMPLPPQQNMSGPPLPGSHNSSNSLLHGQQNTGSLPQEQENTISAMKSSMQGQQNLSGPPLQRQPNLPSLSQSQQNTSGSLPQSQQNFSGQPLRTQQNLSGPPLPGQQNMSGPPLHGQQNAVGSLLQGQQNMTGSMSRQQNLSGPPLPGQQNSGLPGQNQHMQGQQNSTAPPPLHGQKNLSGPPLPGQHNLSGPPLPGQQNINTPPLPGQNLSGPPLPGQQNLSGPPLPGQQQNLSGPPLPGQQQNLSGPPLPGQQQNLSGPPLPGQQNFSGPPLPGHQNLSGPQTQTQSLPGQRYQHAPGQKYGHNYGEQPNVASTLSGPLYGGPNQHISTGPPISNQQSMARPPLMNQQNLPTSQYQNQLLSGQSQTSSPGMPPSGQRSHVSGPPLPGQASTSPMGMNRPPTGYQQTGYQQGYQQPDMYGGQRNLYQGGVPSGYASSQQQPKKLDPEHMPSPIQVMQDDQHVRGGVFVTNQRGLVPPLVTTKFVTQDEGNASPRYIRSTMYTVPTTADIIKQTNVPFGLIISPMARIAEGEYEPPIVDMGDIGPVRCVRCKAYMSPFMQFIDAGRRFQCMFCKATTEVPGEYFQHLDHTGQRMDRFERPELMLGAYEYIATKDYCRNNTFPKPPAIVFVIDVSYNTVKSGLVNLLCMKMKSIIKNLPVDAGQTKSNIKIGFITYSNTVHFYNINPCLAQPQMMVVGDVQDVFMPLLDGFLCDIEKSEAIIDSLMAQIPAMFADSRETETILAPAIQAGLEALKASECVGKLLVFHSSLPIAEAPGKLKNRDDRKVLGTDKEKTVLAPQNNVYNNLGQECVNAGCSVDLFVFNNSYVDIATIGQVCRLTGGEVYKYTYFQADIDGDRLITDVINNISRPIAFDAVMRVRTSTGVRPTDFYGHFFMSNTTDMELASIDCNKAVAVEIKHDDKLTDDEGVYIQAALLYTSCGGIRRLRIINLSLKTSSQMAELYRACDSDAIINFFLKQSVFKLIESTPKAVKDSLISRCANMLAAYRKQCATTSNAGQLILPECMKLLPLYINSLLKSDAISGGADMAIDDRAYVMQAVAIMPISISIVYTYPRLLPLHDVDPQDTELPPMLRCSIDKFTDDGVFLLENSVHMFLWIGLAVSPEWVQEVFGVPLVVQVDTDRPALPVLDTPLNKRINDIINHVRSERHHCMRLTIVRQRDKLEMVLRHFLVEDRGSDGSSSYVDFLCHMHKEIRTLLSQ